MSGRQAIKRRTGKDARKKERGVSNDEGNKHREL